MNKIQSYLPKQFLLVTALMCNNIVALPNINISTPRTPQPSTAVPEGGIDGTTIDKWAQTIAIPPFMVPDYIDADGAPHFTINIVEGTQQILPPSFLDKETVIWTYQAPAVQGLAGADTLYFLNPSLVGNGNFNGQPFTPGPTIVVPAGQPFYVTYNNNLPAGADLRPNGDPIHPMQDYIFVINETVDGITVGGDNDVLQQGRTITHFHGLPTTEATDGLPKQWVNPGDTHVAYYPNPSTRSRFSFYHDHAMDITRLNVAAGIAGGFIMLNPEDLAYLPSPATWIPLVIQDRSFYQDTQYLQTYPDTADIQWNRDNLNYDTFMVNGKVWPYCPVTPGPTLLLVLNGCTSTFITVQFQDVPGDLATDLTPSYPFYLVGTDGGLLDTAKTLTTMTLAPAEKAWIIMDFSATATHVYLNNLPNNIVNNSDTGTGIIINDVVRFDVSGTYAGSYNISQFTPTPINPSEQDLLNSVSYIRNQTLDLVNTGADLFVAENRHFNDPVTDNPLFNSVELWNIINLTTMDHPMHTHLTNFYIVDRVPFRAQAPAPNNYADDRLAGTLHPLEYYVAGAPVAPDCEERNAYKETVKCWPVDPTTGIGYITRIVMKFQFFGGPETGPQSYVWHCHILDHEEFDMMRPFTVLPESTYYYELSRKYGQLNNQMAAPAQVYAECPPAIII